MSRRFALLVNPASGGGKALAALPAVTAELDRLGAPNRSSPRAAPSTPREEAAAAAQRARRWPRSAATACCGRCASALRGTETRRRDHPRRAGQRLRAGARRSRPSRRPRPGWPWRAPSARSTSATSTASRSWASPASASTRTPTGSPTRPKLVRGNLVYLYAALRALAGWKPARFTVTVDGERHELTGYQRRRRQLARPTAAGCSLLPHAELDDGQLDVVAVGGDVEAALPARPAEGVQGRPPRRSRASPSCAAAESRSTPTAPFDVYADGDPIGAAPVTVRVEPRCLRVVVPALMFAAAGAGSRACPRAGPPARPQRRHDRCPGGCCCALQPGRAAAHGRRAGRRARC